MQPPPGYDELLEGLAAPVQGDGWSLPCDDTTKLLTAPSGIVTDGQADYPNNAGVEPVELVKKKEFLTRRSVQTAAG